MVGGDDPSHLYCDCCCDPPGGQQLLKGTEGSASPLPWLATDNSSISSSLEESLPPSSRSLPSYPGRRLFRADAPRPPECVPGGGVPCPCDGCKHDEDSMYEEVGFQYFPAPPRRLSAGTALPIGDGALRRLSLPPLPPPASSGLMGTNAVIFPEAVFPLEPLRPTVHAHCGMGGVLRSLGVCGRPASRATEVETVSTYTLDDDASTHPPYATTRGRKTRKARGVKVSHLLASPPLPPLPYLTSPLYPLSLFTPHGTVPLFWFI